MVRGQDCVRWLARLARMATKTRPDDVLGWRALIRRPAIPEGGMRVAWSHLVAILAAGIGFPVGSAIANGLYSSGAVCRGDDSLGCPIITLMLWAGILVLVLLAALAWWFRLGWEWALIVAGLALGLFEIVVDPASPWMLLVALIPTLAALLSDPAMPGRRMRLGIGMGASALAIGFLVYTLATIG